jgi:hypothetical protein
MIKPTVGRQVWYRPSVSDQLGPVPMSVAGSIQRGEAQPLAATIIAVWSDRCVNVQITDVVGRVFTKTSLRLLQEGDDTPKNGAGDEIYGYAEWVPFQQSQVKKEATA